MVCRERNECNRLIVRCVVGVVTLLGFASDAASQSSTLRNLVVLSENASVMDGSRVVGRVELGRQYSIIDTNADWYQIEITVDDARALGWIHSSHVGVKDEHISLTALSSADRARRLYKARSVLAMGRQLERKGNYEQAIPILEYVREVQEAFQGTSSLDHAECLNSLGWCYDCLCDFDVAEPLYTQALDIVKTAAGDQHPDYSRTLQNLGGLCISVGDFSKAELFLVEAVNLRKRGAGRWHQDYANSLNSLAMLYRSIGKYAKAESLFMEAREIWRQTLGESHSDYAYAVINLALLYHEMGQFEQAEQLFEQTKSIWGRTLGEQHPDYAFCLDHLARSYSISGDHTKAEQLHLQSLNIYRNAWGAVHPNCAITLDNLAVLYRTMGDLQKAEETHREALAIWKQTMSTLDPSYASCLSRLASVVAEAERFSEAASLFDQSRRTSQTHIKRVLPGLSETEQLVFLNVKDNSDLHLALSLGVAGADDAEVARLSAGWLLNSKAVAHETIAERAKLASASEDPAVAELSLELRAIRSQLARLTLDHSAINDFTYFQTEVSELLGREQELSKAIGRLYGEEFLNHEWTEIDDVRKTLSAEAVFVDIARLRLRRFHQPTSASQQQSEHYVAWIIPATGVGEVEVIDLGDAVEIDHAIQATREQLDDPLTSILARGENEVAEKLDVALQKVSSLTLQPILTRVGNVRQLILSPDAALWLLPWAALPTAEKRYAIEALEIRYVTSGRELLIRGAALHLPVTSPMVIADPDFDVKLSQLPSESETPAQPRQRRSAEAWPTIPHVERLPATAAEAEAITPTIERYTRREPRVYTGARAQESVFKQAERPIVVTLSTHGFFFEGQSVDQNSNVGVHETRSVALSSTGQPIENPLLRCGLLLAGCNHRDRAHEEQDDGVLTGLEIVGADLRETELVVLSACDTGIGDVWNGEGVAGLRQAFLLAGAENVVSTLWKIPDRESAVLMKSFFDHLANGQSKSEALRNSQLDQIEHRRKINGSAHPFYWAAFTLTGGR